MLLEMQPDLKYWLTLPQGSSYNPVAGNLQRALTVQFASLLPFTTPFRNSNGLSAKNFDQAAYQGSNSRHLELLMPHGLDDEASAGAGVQQRVRVTDYGVPFESYQTIKNLSSEQQPVVLDINATVTSACAASFSLCSFIFVLLPNALMLRHPKVAYILPK